MQSILNFLPYRSSVVAAQTCSSHRLLAESEGQATRVPSWYPRRFIRSNRRPIERHWTVSLNDQVIAIVPHRDIGSDFDATSIVNEGTRPDVPRRPYGLSGDHRFLFKVTEPVVLQHCIEVTVRDSDRFPVNADEAAKWLTQLTAMTTLSCRVTRLKSVSFTATTCPNLVKLDLEHSAVTNEGLRGVEQAPSLRVLTLSWTRITDVTCLSASKTLRCLNLNHSEVTCEGIRGLEKISTLEELDIDDGPLDATADLDRSPSLRRLSLSGSKVASAAVGTLGAIKTLQHLSCNECPNVTDVRGLAASTSLVGLNLRDSPVSTEGILGLERIPTLTSVVLSHTCVTDLNHLADSASLLTVEAECSPLTSGAAAAFGGKAHVRLLLGGTPAADHM